MYLLMGTCKADVKVSNLFAAHQRASPGQIKRQAKLGATVLGMPGCPLWAKGELSSNESQADTRFGRGVSFALGRVIRLLTDAWVPTAFSFAILSPACQLEMP